MGGRWRSSPLGSTPAPPAPGRGRRSGACAGASHPGPRRPGRQRAGRRPPHRPVNDPPPSHAPSVSWALCLRGACSRAPSQSLPPAPPTQRPRPAMGRGRARGSTHLRRTRAGTTSGRPVPGPIRTHFWGCGPFMAPLGGRAPSPDASARPSHAGSQRPPALRSRGRRAAVLVGAFALVGDTGLEPVTSAMSTQRSSRLS